MKVLLKSKDSAKLYKGDLDMNSLTHFIASSLKLEANHYTLTYKDEEGDDISIVTDADLSNVQELNQGRNFLKINLNTEELVLTEYKEEDQDKLRKKEEKEKLR